MTIHKRNRTPIKTEGIGSTIPSSCSTIDSSPEDSISCSSIPKRKKYKVVPNEPIKSVLSQFEVQNKAPLTPLASSISEEQLPDDRKELLQFVSFESYSSNECLQQSRFRNNGTFFAYLTTLGKK